MDIASLLQSDETESYKTPVILKEVCPFKH